MISVSTGWPRRRRTFVAGLVVLATACGQKAPGAPSDPGTTSARITINSTGVSPKNVDIGLGERVLFINNDARPHSIGSNPHPDHTDCPNINQAGFLGPGQRHETGNFVVARVCGFHDHDDPTNQSLWGTITTR
jgi:plastocyanin